MNNTRPRFTQFILGTCLALSLACTSSMSASSIDTTPDKKPPTLNKKRTVKEKLNEHLDKQKQAEQKNQNKKLKTDTTTATTASDVFIKIPDIDGESKPAKGKATKEMKVIGKKILQNDSAHELTHTVQQKATTAQKTDNQNSKTKGINTIKSTPACDNKDINSIKQDSICKKDDSED